MQFPLRVNVIPLPSTATSLANARGVPQSKRKPSQVVNGYLDLTFMTGTSLDLNGSFLNTF